MKVSIDIIDELILGSTFYGTGGGGSPIEARQIFELAFSIKSEIDLLNLNNFDDTAIFTSCFGIGSIGSLGNPEKPIKDSLKYLEMLIGDSISGIVSVEIGPKSLAMAFYLAALLDLPVLDSDIVGGRSTPEVFLETITLFDLPRTPAILSNNAGDFLALLKSCSAKQEELFMRDFSSRSNGQAYVLGYKINKKQAMTALEPNTVSDCVKCGKLFLEKGSETLNCLQAKQIFLGKIVSIETKEDSGFLTQTVYLENNKDCAKLFIKNENLIVWVNNKLSVTCPDLIFMINPISGYPIYNLDLKENIEVKIYALPAKKLWRSKKGIELFNPKVFGFNFDAKLLD